MIKDTFLERFQGKINKITKNGPAQLEHAQLHPVLRSLPGRTLHNSSRLSAKISMSQILDRNENISSKTDDFHIPGSFLEESRKRKSQIKGMMPIMKKSNKLKSIKSMEFRRSDQLPLLQILSPPKRKKTESSFSEMPINTAPIQSSNVSLNLKRQVLQILEDMRKWQDKVKRRQKQKIREKEKEKQNNLSKSNTYDTDQLQIDHLRDF